MEQIKIKLNRAAVREQLLKSPAITGMCLGIAQQMAANAGPGYKVRPVN